MKIESISRSIKEHPFMAPLPDGIVEFFSGCAKNVRLQANEYLFREGAEGDTFYLIRKGRVDLESQHPSAGAVALESLGEGESLGATVVTGPHEWHLDARAVTPVLAFAVDGQCLRNKLEQDHEFGYHMLKRMLSDVHGRLARSRLQQLDVYKAEFNRSPNAPSQVKQEQVKQGQLKEAP